MKMSSNVVPFILYGIALAIGIVSIAQSYFGLPWNYDTETLITLGLIIVAIGSIVSLTAKRTLAQTPQTPHPTPSQPDSMKVEAFCMKCRKKVEAKNAHEEIFKNKRKAMAGACPNCGTKVLRIMKKE